MSLDDEDFEDGRDRDDRVALIRRIVGPEDIVLAVRGRVHPFYSPHIIARLVRHDEIYFFHKKSLKNLIILIFVVIFASTKQIYKTF